MRVLVTGASGFAGEHLCRTLRAAGYDVVTAASSGDVDATVDVTDRDAVSRTVRDAAPAGVFHLAALAFVPAADRDPKLADAVNRGGTANVLAAAAAAAARTLIVSSGAVYGRLLPGELPAREDGPLRPEGAYAVSKAAAERECFARAARQEIVVVRPFNHTGPGQDRAYVCSDFAAQIAECEAGIRPPVLEVGDLGAERDFSDVRDVVAAYVAAFERGRAGEVYNVCSGRPTPVSAVLEGLVAAADVSVDVVKRAERTRENEVRSFYGSNEKILRDTGWRPAVALARTLADLLDDWRSRIAPRAGRGTQARGKERS